ncbi:MAG: hypothetical protein A3J97_16620 [Spirochaetes bacterium RIFOXYC1_FULL_54_7]|nr:MAG: hypothetical protein A3J97_16620 [Spirochaetes bacterium RIFOXYC1_FULL_54_7]
MKTRGQSAISVLVFALLTTVMPVVAQERVDLVILLDSSRSMFRYYNQVIDFVVSDTVREYLRFGDGFHLMNFADTTQLEVAQVLRTEEDVRKVLSRLYLMYPLGRNTDMISALKGVSQYVSGLASSSSKYIILITDGMHSPAPDSMHASYSAAEVRVEMERIASRIRDRGWIMRIVQVPFNGTGRSDFSAVESIPPKGTPQAGDAVSGVPQSSDPTSRSSAQTTLPPTGSDEYEVLSDVPGTGDYIADIASVLGTSVSTFDPENASSTLSDMVDILQLSFPEDIRTRSLKLKVRIGIENPGERRIPFELEAIRLPDGNNILSSRAIADLGPGKSIQMEIDIRLPGTVQEGTTVLILEPRLANDVRVSPATSTITVQLKIPAFATFFRNSASILVFLVILIAALAILILLTRYIRAVHRRAEEPVLQAFMGSSESNDEEYRNREPKQAYSRSTAAQAPGLTIASRNNAYTQTPSITSTTSPNATTSTSRATAPGATGSGAIVAGSTTAGYARNIDSSSSLRPDEDRTRLLDQWSQGDRNRYTLPLKATIENRQSKGSDVVADYVFTPRVLKPGTLRVELRVRNQNPFIGSRNIKTLHSGGHRTIGGKSSDFLVFLLPIPKRIADIHYDGQNITIVPVRSAFFPDYPGPISACMGEEIRIVNYRGKELFLRFERYTPPLEKLNMLLHCIEVPGPTHATDQIPQA